MPWANSTLDQKYDNLLFNLKTWIELGCNNNPSTDYSDLWFLFKFR